MTQHLVRYRRPARKVPRDRVIERAVRGDREAQDELLREVEPGETVTEILIADEHGRVHASPVVAYLGRLREGPSVATMTSQIRHVATALAELGVGTGNYETFPWWTLTYAHTSKLQGLFASTLEPGTANARLNALRGVLKACARIVDQYGVPLMTYDAMCRAMPSSVKGSREPKGRALTGDEIKALFAACEPAPDETGVRDRALLALLYGLGLRLAEVAALDVKKLEGGGLDIVGDEEVRLRVLGKGNFERMMPIQGSAIRALHAYLDIRRGEPEGPMFLHLRGSATRLGRSGITSRVKLLAKKAGVECAVHDLRRSFGTALIDKTGDLSAVSKLMGHKHLSTTMLYDKRGEKAKRAVIKKLPEWE